jgi:SAM-dependent methyltransferase
VTERFEPEAVEPDHYDAAYYEGNGQAGDRPALGWYVRMVRRYLGAGPYLDFGCGTGHLVRRLAAHGEAAGLEISPYSAVTARSNAPGCTVYSTLDEIPSSTFRAITSIHVLEHLDDDTARRVLACWRRVLTPGGRVLVVMPDPAGRARALAGDAWAGYTDPTHVNLKPHAAWRSFFVDEGFTIVREGSDGLWNVPYGRLPKLVDAAYRSVPSLAQLVSGRLFLRPGQGESSVFVIERLSAD